MQLVNLNGLMEMGNINHIIGKSGGYWKGFIVVNPENWEIGGVQGWTYLNK